jgi:hypothetical protein
MTNDQYTTEDATQELLRISKWPEPLRLAYLLEKEMLWPLHGKAADCLRSLHEELGATNRQVEILSDALAESRQWVGLTQDEFRDFASTLDYGTGGLIRAIEAKLKEKNT